jgi:hypothetical protein
MLKKYILLSAFLSWASLGLAQTQTTIPKEDCGLKSEKKFFEFTKKSFLISDIGTIEFTPNGGFIFYTEDGTNTFWHVNPDNFSIDSRSPSVGQQGYTKHTLASLPNPNSGSSNSTTNPGWRRTFNELDDDLIAMSMYMINAKGSTVAEAGAALNCAQKIMYSTLYRAQASFLDGQTSQR